MTGKKKKLIWISNFSFYLIEENEKEIRNNPKARTTKILKKIFN